MTTTETPHATTETVRDPAWLRAWIAQATARSATFAEGVVGDLDYSHGRERDSALARAELTYLKERLTALDTFLRVLGPEGDGFLAELRSRVPGAVWYRSMEGFFTGGPVGDAEKWADQLGLPEHDRVETGSRMWADEVDGYRAEVFGQ